MRISVRTISLMMTMTLTALLLSVFLACAGKETAAAPVAGTQPAAVNSGANPLPPGHPPIAANAANAANAAPAAAAAAIKGKVVETMDAGGYTYLQIKTAEGEQWAAVRQAQVSKGSSVVVNAEMTMDHFQSKTLNRTFDHIVFGSLAGGAEPSAPPPAMASADPTPKGHMLSPHSEPVAGVTRADGPDGRTVAEVWAQLGELKDKSVTVHGKVVKFLPQIMGHNWLHVRDGSGTSGKGDDDITVTTSDKVAVGDVVTVRGVVHADRDFGSGYRYGAIIENAKVSK